MRADRRRDVRFVSLFRTVCYAERMKTAALSPTPKAPAGANRIVVWARPPQRAFVAALVLTDTEVTRLLDLPDDVPVIESTQPTANAVIEDRKRAPAAALTHARFGPQNCFHE